jgi:polyhydroxybutyrate depolymerase
MNKANFMKLICKLFLIAILFNACKKSTTDVITPTPAVDSPLQQVSINITVDGLQRNFIMYLPTGYNNAGKMPMMIVMHGGSGEPTGMIQLADFRPIAERDKVVLVYPAGTQTSWNDGRPTASNLANVNDVNFISQICTYMVANKSVDATKIYATGISNGGFMASRLGCELSDKIAAIAAVAGSMEQNTIAANCNTNGRTMPVIYIQGTNDPLVSFNGGIMTVGAGGTILSHAQVVAKWIGINNCGATPIITDLPDIANDGTTIKQRVYSNTTNGTEVVSYVVANGGHTWPQGYQYLGEAVIGKTSQDMNACEVIWQFFKRFKR